MDRMGARSPLRGFAPCFYGLRRGRHDRRVLRPVHPCCHHRRRAALFDAAFDDIDAWITYLPALGHTITVERLQAKLEKALRDPDFVDDDDDAAGQSL